jgi:hypothetical protein
LKINKSFSRKALFYGFIKNQHSTGDISGGAYYTGGIAGHSAGDINNSFSVGKVSGHSEVGGIAGRVSGSITNSYSIGDVSGTDDAVGGIAGEIGGGIITKSYSIGSVTGYDTNDFDGNSAGGIVGYVYGDVSDNLFGASEVTNNAAINQEVNGSSNVNRIVGYLSGSNTIQNNFALDTMITNLGSFSHATNSAYHGTDKSDSDLKSQSTYSDAINDDGLGGLGWSFGNDEDNPWKIDANKNDGYPYLYWQK